MSTKKITITVRIDADHVNWIENKRENGEARNASVVVRSALQRLVDAPPLSADIDDYLREREMTTPVRVSRAYQVDGALFGAVQARCDELDCPITVFTNLAMDRYRDASVALPVVEARFMDAERVE